MIGELTERIKGLLAEPLLAAADPTASGADGTAEPEPGFTYRPLWDVRRKVLSTYQCFATGKDRSLKLETGYRMLPLGAEPMLFLKLDLLAVQRAVRDLGRLLAQGRRLLVACPVHCRTLGDVETRDLYAEVGRHIPDDHRPYLVFELVGVPEDMPATRLRDMRLSLNNYGARTVLARLQLTHAKFAGLADGGIAGVGADLAVHSEPEAQLMQLMTRFAERASRGGLRTFVHGLRSTSMATAAVCAGFDFVDGDAVAATVDAPDQLQRFQPHDLFARLFGRAR